MTGLLGMVWMMVMSPAYGVGCTWPDATTFGLGEVGTFVVSDDMILSGEDCEYEHEGHIQFQGATISIPHNATVRAHQITMDEATIIQDTCAISDCAGGMLRFIVGGDGVDSSEHNFVSNGAHFLLNAKDGSHTGKSLYIEAEDNIEFHSDDGGESDLCDGCDKILLSGKPIIPDIPGIGGNLTLVSGQNIVVDAPINANGKQSDGIGHHGGAISMTAGGNIDIRSSIITNGKTQAGSINITASGNVTVGDTQFETNTSDTGSTGTMRIEGSEIDFTGVLESKATGTASIDGGKAWFFAWEKLTLTSLSQLLLTGESGAEGGTVRVDVINRSGAEDPSEINGIIMANSDHGVGDRLGAGGVVSIHAKTPIQINGRINAAGGETDGAPGGQVEIVSTGDIEIGSGCDIQTGGGHGGRVDIRSRKGAARLAGEITTTGSGPVWGEEYDWVKDSTLLVEACSIEWAESPDLNTSSGAMVFVGRSGSGEDGRDIPPFVAEDSGPIFHAGDGVHFIRKPDPMIVGGSWPPITFIFDDTTYSTEHERPCLSTCDDIEGIEGTLYDMDGDGYPSNRLITSGTDCNDLDPTVHPGATEFSDDDIDSNCSCGVPSDEASYIGFLWRIGEDVPDEACDNDGSTETPSDVADPSDTSGRFDVCPEADDTGTSSDDTGGPPEDTGAVEPEHGDTGGDAVEPEDTGGTDTGSTEHGDTDTGTSTDSGTSTNMFRSKIRNYPAKGCSCTTGPSRTSSWALLLGLLLGLIRRQSANP